MTIFQCSEVFLPVIDGVGRVVKAYTETLSRRGHDIYVITPTDDTGFRGRLGYEILDYTSVRFRKNLPYRIGSSGLDPHFKERIKMIQPDIIHAHAPATSGRIAVKLAKKKNVPLVGSFHSKYYDDVLKMTHSKTLARLSMKIVIGFYNKCDEVWAVSENAAETLKSYGYKGEVTVMPNGTDKRVLKSEIVPEVLKKYGIDKSRTIFLFVGQINWKKNIRRSMEALSILKKDGLDFQFVLAGQGPDEEDIKKTAISLGISDNMIFTGHILDGAVLDALYHAADLFLFPSIYDNAPMVVREAACMKTPSIVVAGSSSAEIINPGVNGLTSEDTSEAFSTAIKSYLDLSEAERDEIGLNAYNTIPVPWNTIMDTVEERYSALIEQFKSERRKK